MNNQLQEDYNPDILETIANLSNDEVFTPPTVARDMLDMLPKEVWSNSELKFLDPAVKTGIFLREITSRLIEGLADEIPDLQERVNHILTKQVYGVGITELTTLMSRRTLYCSKDANGPYSICTEFESAEGNILFPDTEHDFNEKTGRCVDCGANRDNYESEAGRENYAYSFIHKDFEEVFGDMKFDVIIGNPPYQLEDGAGGASSSPLYDKFVENAIKMNPKYISMITPSRWFYGGKGLDDFRNKMIKDTRMKKIVDYQSSLDCFPNMGINGGINYFLWDESHNGKCNIKNIRSNGKTNFSDRLLLHENLDVFINDNILYEIIVKVEKLQEESFDRLISPRDPYQVKDANEVYKERKDETDLIIYGHQIKGYTKKENVLRESYNHKHKAFISYAYGGNINEIQVINKPFIPEENAICTGTYLSIGPFESKDECNNALSYMKTKFFRAMVYALKKTQHGTKRVYQFVPLQDFSKSWTDEELYKKYKLTQEEIDYIEENIAEME